MSELHGRAKLFSETPVRRAILTLVIPTVISGVQCVINGLREEEASNE